MVPVRVATSSVKLKWVLEAYYDIECVAPSRPPALPDILAGCDALILGDVSVEQLGKKGIASILEFLKQGGGLLVHGGWHAYQLGGWHETALREVVPFCLTEPSEYTQKWF